MERRIADYIEIIGKIGGGMMKPSKRFGHKRAGSSLGPSGFTLVELLLVIVILGILAGIAVPAYIGQRTRAMHSEAKANLEALRLLQEQYYAENGRYAPDPDARWQYKDTSAADSGIEDVLPGFRPGDKDNLKFDYYIESTASGTAFVANAVGKAGTQVEGAYLFIDQDNDRNF
ncbi:MAG: hypothetical protein Kow0025_21340 [Thermodesulfovibrionales bacterium]